MRLEAGQNHPPGMRIDGSVQHDRRAADGRERRRNHAFPLEPQHVVPGFVVGSRVAVGEFLIFARQVAGV
ncbi:MAG TPA: hypothetical protein VN893_11965 [Bryobacteraceae bacterium]|nr:hypothetical protein [Bryobacteraceae bacterium]